MYGYAQSAAGPSSHSWSLRISQNTKKVKRTRHRQPKRDVGAGKQPPPHTKVESPASYDAESQNFSDDHAANYLVIGPSMMNVGKRTVRPASVSGGKANGTEPPVKYDQLSTGWLPEDEGNAQKMRPESNGIAAGHGAAPEAGTRRGMQRPTEPFSRIGELGYIATVPFIMLDGEIQNNNNLITRLNGGRLRIHLVLRINEQQRKEWKNARMTKFHYPPMAGPRVGRHIQFPPYIELLNCRAGICCVSE
ncbi:hypothetical protein B0H11DRAFT_2404913 [Mycena galericulata]|nr:hypothetical protein B0H11DRAFT_2404913 [Mycena galericulata]